MYDRVRGPRFTPGYELSAVDRRNSAGRDVILAGAAFGVALGGTSAFRGALSPQVPFALFCAAASGVAATRGGRAGAAVAVLGTATLAYLANDAGPGVVVPGAVLVGVTALIAHLSRSGRRQAAELAVERERLRVILTSTADAMVAVDASGAVTSLNPAAERITGWPATAATGRPACEVVRLEYPDDSTGSDAPDGHPMHLPSVSWAVRPDGMRIPIDASVARLQAPGGAEAGSVIIFRDVSARRESEDRLLRQVERLRLLSDAAGQLLGRDSPEATLRTLFGQVSARLGLDAFFHYRVDASGTALRLESWAGVPDETAHALSRLEFGQAVCGSVAASCRAIVLEDVQHSEDSRAATLKPLGIRAFACHPLIAGDRLLGTLSFGLRDRGRFDVEELGLLKTICYYVSAAIERARMLDEAKERADRLAEGQERLRMAIDLAEVGTWDLDPATGTVRWSDRSRAAFGVRLDADVTYDSFLARIHPEDRERVRLANLHALGPEGPHDYSAEYRVVRPDGSVRWIAAMGRAFPASSDRGRRLIGTVLDVTSRKEQDRQAAVLEERTRMAREIHDTLAQAFTGIILHLEAADQAIDHRPDAVRGRVAEARNLARASLAEARRSVWAFRPQALEGGDLCAALHQLAQQSARQDDVRIEFTSAGVPSVMGHDVEDHLLRVAQEALTNALKHARAGTIAVELDYTPTVVRLRVRDDGTGFARPQTRGFGLIGMRERAQQIGGELTIASRTGTGTEVIISVPVDRDVAGGP